MCGVDDGAGGGGGGGGGGGCGGEGATASSVVVEEIVGWGSGVVCRGSDFKGVDRIFGVIDVVLKAVGLYSDFNG